MKTGIELIADERRRQVEVEGWTPEHDEEHREGELALVAALYATPKPLFELSITDDRGQDRHSHRGVTVEVDDPWPSEWGVEFDKRGKHDRIRQLTVAGALIAAELDRMLRIEAELRSVGAYS